MPHRTLGNSDVTLSPLVFGGNVFGWTADRGQSFAILDRLAEVGLNSIDTADMYSSWVAGNKGGESETIIGDWMKERGNRADMVIITKVGMEFPGVGRGLSAAHIERSIEGSLRRLNTDYVDVYFSHCADDTVPVEETLAAYDRLIRAGKVRTIGASNHNPDQLKAALAAASDNGLPRYEVLEPNYNLYDRLDFESGLRDLALTHNLGIIPYYSLANGFLTGKYRTDSDRSKSPRGHSMTRYMTPRGFAILEALDQIASSHRTDPGAVALAWLIQRPGISAPIASARNLDQLPTLIRATTLTLSADEVAELDRVSAV